MTAQQLIEASLRVIGVLASGETASSLENADALQSLNDLLASWSTERTYVFTILKEQFPLSAASSFTIGFGATFNTARPQHISSANVIIDGLTYPLRIINSQEYADALEKDLSGKAPLVIYNNYEHPISTLYLWPSPSVVDPTTLELWTWKALTSVAALAATLDFPPGYQRALRYALAMELAPEYGVVPSDHVAKIAANAQTLIQGLNAKNSIPSAVLDPPEAPTPEAA